MENPKSMRSPERLIEVIRTINPHIHPINGMMLRLMADDFEAGKPLTDDVAGCLHGIAEMHRSAHIADLAKDLLTKWKERA